MASLLTVPGDSDVPPGMRRGRSASLAWVDFLSTDSPFPSDDDERRGSVSVPIYDHTKQSENQPIRIDDEIFNSFADDDGKILVGKFLAMLENHGLRRTDYRLKELFLSLKRILKEEEIAHRGHLNDDFIGSVETLQLTREVFADCIIPNIIVISAAFRNQFIIPRFDAFCQEIENLYIECKELNQGYIAPYLKQLEKFDVSNWGVSLCTTDGQRFSIGDTNTPVTLHSISKPIMYAFALQEIGKDAVHKYVGQEPSGHLFNELVLDQEQRPHNPMINAGSIMIHALLQSLSLSKLSNAERFDYTHELFHRLSGNEYIGFNNGMFLSKRQASDRNWALAHFMNEYKCFPPGTDLADTIEYYLQTSSLETTCEVLSVVASTLANGGVCPITGERVLNGDVVADVLSVLFSCGMLEFSGKFAFRVGLPAKSSISGLVLLMIPNVCGMALWSPQLDSFSNSSRGVEFCERLVKTFSFHCFDTLRTEKVDPRRKVVETKGAHIITLMFSAAKGDLDAVFRLHLCGMDMGLHDYDGRTALHLAACEGHYEIVEYLLMQCGVHHLFKDRWGNTPYDEAIRCNQLKIAELLRNWHPGKVNFYNHSNTNSSTNLRGLSNESNIPEQDSQESSVGSD